MSTISIHDQRAAPSKTPPASGRGPALRHLVTGALLILIGIGWLVEVTGAVHLSWDLVLTLALMGVGVAIMAEVRHGTSGWLVTLGLILTGILTVTSLTDVDLRGGVGNSEYAPRTVADLRDSYRLAVGDMTLDLRNLTVPEGVTALKGNVGIGKLAITVPANTAVQIKAHSNTGTIVLFGDTSNEGVDVTKEFTSPDYATAARRLSLDLTVGVGRIEVQR